MRTILLGLLLVALPSLFGACGTSCSQIAADRADFLARTGSDDAPHMAVSVPFAIANPLMRKQLQPLPAVSVPLPGGLPAVRLAVGSVALEPAPAGRVGLRLRIDVGDANNPVAHLTARVALTPTFEAGGRVVRVSLRGADLRGVDATLSPKAADALADALLKRLPAAARLLPQKQVSALLGKAARTVATRGFAELRDRALVRAGTLVSIAVRLPDVPVRDVTVKSTGDRLVLAVQTTLPVERGLEADDATPRDPGIAVRLAGSTLAELANLASEKGELASSKPGRSDHGDCTYGFGWSGGEQPLAVVAWCHDEPCKLVRISATPRITVRGERMTVKMVGEVESVRGPPVMELASWLGLAARPVRFAVETASRLELVSGDRPLSLRVVSAAFDSAGMTMALEAAE